MKLIPYFLTLGTLCLIPFTGRAATAQVRMYSLSLKFSQSSDQYGDRLDLTSTALRDSGLGELGPPFPVWEPPVPGSDGYSAYILLFDTATFSTFSGMAYLSLPPMDDLDGNRYPDFFEVSKAVNFDRFSPMNITGYGSVYPQVFWSRTAGSRNGFCTIQIDDGYWGTFRTSFELSEYTGTLTYTPGSPVVSGNINMTKTGDSSKTISGPISFAKSASDPYNSLTNQPGTWPGAPALSQTFASHYFSRDAAWPSNYVGLIEFSDGLEYTFEPYSYYVLSITDMTDTDGDGIPNFSDDAQVVQPPRAPRVSLAKGGSGLQFTIAGDVGHLHEIQETSSLSAPNWQTVESVTLSTDPQTVTVAVPAGTRFWRVVAQ